MAPTRKLAELFYDLRIKTEGLQQDVTASERHLGKLSKFVIANPVAAMAAVGTAALASALAAAKMAAGIETSLRRVAAATPGGVKGFAELRDTLRDVSRETGKAQEELAVAAEAIARAGAGSAEEVGTRLRAVVQLSQATGLDLQSVIGGLDQVLDLFNVSAADSARVLGELFAAAKGRGDVGELFAQMQAAAPAIQKLGLDLPTAARALVAIGDNGRNAKQSASILNDLAKSGAEGRKQIESLAASIPRAVDPMGQLATAAREVNESTEALGARLRAEFSATLIDLGTSLLPLVNSGLRTMLDAIVGLRGASSLAEGIRVLNKETGKLFAGAAFGPKAEALLGGGFDRVRDALSTMVDETSRGNAALKALGGDGLLSLIKQLDATEKALTSTGKNVDGQLGNIQRLRRAAQTAFEEILAGSRATLGTPQDPKKGVTDPEEAKRAADAIRERAKAFREVGDAFEDLLGRAQRGDVTIQEFDRGVRDLGQKFLDLKNPTAAMRAEFTAFQAELSALRPAIVNLKTEALALEFRKLMVEMTPDTVDDFRLSLELLARELKKSGFTGDQVDQIIRLRTEMEKVRKEAEIQRNVIAATVASSLTPIEKLNQLTKQRQDLEAERVALTGKQGPDADARRVKIAELLLSIEEAMADVGEQNAGNLEAMSGKSLALATALSDAASAAFGISTAFLGANHDITTMIGGVAQVANGFSRIASLAKEAGSLSKLLSTGAGFASALPAIGGIIGGIAALSTRQADPEAAERRKEQAAIISALQAIQKNTGDLLNVSASGNDLSALKVALAGLLSSEVVQFIDSRQTGRRQQLEQRAVRGGFEATSLEELSRLSGLTIDELKRIASEIGFPLSSTVESLRGFLKALQDSDPSAFVNSFAGQLRRLEVEARLDPQAFDGVLGVIERIKVLTGDKGAPAIAEALAGLDLTNLADQATAIERLTAILRNPDLGKLDRGDLNLNEFIEEILRAIEGLKAAQPKVKTASEQFADAMEALGVQVEFGSLDAKGKLDAALRAFAQAFPDLSKLVDTSSAEAFKKSIQAIIDGFAADGDLSEAERAQIAVLRALVGAFNDATPAAAKLVDSLTAMIEQADLLGISARDQVDLLLASFTSDKSIAGNKNFDLLKGLTDGLDVSTAEGVAALRERAKQIVLKLAEGGVTEEEQAVIDALRRIVGTAQEAADDAAREATEAAERERARRKKILADAEGAIAFEDIKDPAEILRRRIAAVSEAFPQLAGALANIDLTTEEGRKAFDDLLTSLRKTFAESPELADLMGLSVEELLEALGFLEGGLDSLGDSILSVTDQINEALAALETDLDIAGITDPIERLQKSADTIGKVDKRIGDALAGLDLTTADGRKKAEAALQALAVGADADLKKIILQLLKQIRGIPEEGTGPQGAGASGNVSTPAGRENIASAASITEVTANRWLDLMTTDLALSRERNSILQSIVGALSGGPAIQPPAIAFPSLAGGSPANLGGRSGPAIEVNLGGIQFLGPVTTADVTELGQSLQRSLAQFVDRQLSGELLLALQRLGISQAGLA